MSERLFSTLTLLVAICEQSLLDLGGVEPRPDALIAIIEQTRDEAIALARSIPFAA